MQLVIECDCGWSFRGAEREVIAAGQEHGRDAHDLTLSPEQVLAAARPVSET